MRASGDYYVTVIEDTRKNKIIGSATLVLEKKFIRNCAIVSGSVSIEIHLKMLFFNSEAN